MLLAATKSSGSSATFFLILLVAYAAYAAFYFLYLRPRQKKNKATREQARAVEVGDKVQTIGGLVATVSAMDEKIVTLRTESGQELQFLKQAIAQRYVEPTPPEPSEGESEGDHA